MYDLYTGKLGLATIVDWNGTKSLESTQSIKFSYVLCNGKYPPNKWKPTFVM